MTTHSLTSNRRAAGFSLIELMVTVAIATILVTVAVPSYLYEVRKGRRTDAKTALLDLAGREERYFSINNGLYTTSLASLGYGATATFPISVGSSGEYQITSANFSVTAGTTTTVATFSITATPTAGTDQAKDTNCATFTITNTGAQTSTNSSGTATTNCW
jgi:type IV pilus assembly protein PilE